MNNLLIPLMQEYQRLMEVEAKYEEWRNENPDVYEWNFDVTIPATIANEDIKELYHELFECFVGLGEIDLGFTWEQIETAYLDKNKINHERQENKY